MSNITNLLRELDGDIARHRHAIRDHQVAIQELEDARVVLMRREEFKAYANGQPSPFGTIPNGEIVVRDPRVTDHSRSMAALEDGTLSRAIKQGTTPEEEAKKAKKAQYNRDYHREHQMRKQREAETAAAAAAGEPPPPPKGRTVKGRRTRLYWDDIVKLLKSNSKSEFDVAAITDRLGLDLKPQDKQPLYQCLYEMRRQGVIISPSGTGTYQIAPNPPVSNG